MATLTAALGGLNSDPNNLKQPVNRNNTVFSGNKTYAFDKI